MPVLLAASLYMATQLAQIAAPDAPRIVVQGSGSVKTAPTVATLSFDVRGEGATSDRAVAAMVAVSAAVEGALKTVDPNIDIRSDRVRVQAVRPKDCGERDYEDAVHLSKGECAVTGYVAVQDYAARTARVASAGTLVGLAGRKGAYNPKVESFDLLDRTEAKRAAIAKAMADAAAKADAVAAGTGVRRGAILSVVLDNAREEAVIVLTGARRAPVAERDEPIEVSMNPSPVETAAQVTVSYAIVR